CSSYAGVLAGYDVQANGTSGDLGVGIYVGAVVGTVNVFYNSVTLQNTSLTGGNHPSFGFASGSSTPTLIIRNNIFSSTGTTGANLNRAMGFNYSSFTNVTSDNNDLVFSGTGSAAVQTVNLTNSGATSYSTVAAWNTASSKDANSISVAPTFTSTTDLHIVNSNASNITNLYSKGAVVAVTTDFDGSTRGTISTDIGADEFIPSTTTAWEGNTSTAWATSGNWKQGNTPSSGTHIIIPGSASNQPVLSGTTTIGNLSFTGSGATLSINGENLTINGTVSGTSGRLVGSAASNLTMGHTTGTNTLLFDRTNDGTSNALNNFTLIGSGGTTAIGDVSGAGTAQLYVNGILDVQTGATLDVNQSVSGNHLVLVSDGTSLARVADLGATGSRLAQGANTKIVVERSTLSKRAWRLIAAPLTGNGLGYSTSQQSVQYQWQNHQTSPLNTLGGTGFGTNIYGPSGTGMDAVRPGYSMLRWNYGLQNWRNVTNTTTEPMFGNGASGYTSTTDSTVLPTFLFARGDKTITTTTGSNAGRLRAVGKLLTGQQVFNYPGVGTGTKYVAIANPYAAPVDFESLMAGLSSNLKNPSGNTIYYYWDPSLNNFGGAFGGWVTVTRDNAGGYTQNSGTNGRYIQSGTAILVQPSDQLASSATFQESYKATTVVAGTHGAGNSTIDKLVVQLRNADNAIGILDGTIAMFGIGYRKEFDKTEDGIKLEQNNESLSFINGSLKTGVESRGYIQQADTLQMNLVRTTTGTNYAFEFDPSNFDATVTSAKLVDKFLNSETPISLSAKT
ncbi:MAG: beta strand repeat-containing protein, partial [Dolichospermum sp.]